MRSRVRFVVAVAVVATLCGVGAAGASTYWISGKRISYHTIAVNRLTAAAITYLHHPGARGPQGIQGIQGVPGAQGQQGQPGVTKVDYGYASFKSSADSYNLTVQCPQAGEEAIGGGVENSTPGYVALFNYAQPTSVAAGSPVTAWQVVANQPPNWPSGQAWTYSGYVVCVEVNSQ